MKLSNLSKNFSSQTSVQLTIPTNWYDFASLLTIRSGGKLVKFQPYDYQIELVKLLQQRSVIIAKSRQLGISETIASYMLWRAASNPGYLGLVFSKGQADTALIARRIRRMLVSVGLETVTDNLADIELTTGGRLLFRNSKPDNARSLESVVDVFYDEAAFVDSFKDIRDAVSPTQQMVPDSREFIVSTPNQKSGLFWDILNSSNPNDLDLELENITTDEPFKHWVDDGGWGKVLIHWRSHPVYSSQPNFLENIHTQQKLTWETIAREYNLSFDSQKEGLAIYSFNNLHVDDCEYDSRFPICVSFDFNCNPATAIITQKIINKIIVLEEFYINNSNTFESSEIVAQRLLQMGVKKVYLYGDASGKMNTANSQQSNWDIVNQTFKKNRIYAIKKYPERNPSIIDTLNVCNDLFIGDAYGHNRVVIDESCKELILDFKECCVDDYGKLIKKDLKRKFLNQSLRI